MSENTNVVDGDILVGNLIYEHPETMNVLFSIGMGCLGCPASQMESLSDAAKVHGFDPDVVVNAVNNAILSAQSDQAEAQEMA